MDVRFRRTNKRFGAFDYPLETMMHMMIQVLRIACMPMVMERFIFRSLPNSFYCVCEDVPSVGTELRWWLVRNRWSWHLQKFSSMAYIATTFRLAQGFPLGIPRAGVSLWRCKRWNWSFAYDCSFHWAHVTLFACHRRWRAYVVAMGQCHHRTVLFCLSFPHGRHDNTPNQFCAAHTAQVVQLPPYGRPFYGIDIPWRIALCRARTLDSAEEMVQSFKVISISWVFCFKWHHRVFTKAWHKHPLLFVTCVAQKIHVPPFGLCYAIRWCDHHISGWYRKREEWWWELSCIARNGH